MRRKLIAAVLAAALVLAGSGCTKVKDQITDYDKLVKETLAREYSFTADFAYDGAGAAAQVVKTGTADLSVEFSAPEALEGLWVTATDEEIKVRFRGMDVDLSAYTLPTQSILTLLREVLTGEKEGKLTTQVEGDTVVASGTIVLTTYQIVFEKETMKIQKVLIPSVEGEVIISDFTFLEQDGKNAS